MFWKLAVCRFILFSSTKVILFMWFSYAVTCRVDIDLRESECVKECHDVCLFLFGFVDTFLLATSGARGASSTFDLYSSIC